MPKEQAMKKLALALKIREQMRGKESAARTSMCRSVTEKAVRELRSLISPTKKLIMW